MLPGLEARLAEPHAQFLDVGVGGGGFVGALCRHWIHLEAVGIDIWEPALALARERVRKAGLEDRIALRMQDVAELEDLDALDLTWIPGEFIGAAALLSALRRIRLAARPGGWIILSALRGGTELIDSLALLHAMRAGGSAISPGEAEELLRSDGWEAVHCVTTDVPRALRLVVGRRPDRA